MNDPLRKPPTPSYTELWVPQLDFALLLCLIQLINFEMYSAASFKLLNDYSDCECRRSTYVDKQGNVRHEKRKRRTIREHLRLYGRFKTWEARYVVRSPSKLHVNWVNVFIVQCWPTFPVVGVVILNFNSEPRFHKVHNQTSVCILICKLIWLHSRRGHYNGGGCRWMRCWQLQPSFIQSGTVPFDEVDNAFGVEDNGEQNVEENLDEEFGQPTTMTICLEKLQYPGRKVSVKDCLCKY